MSSTAGFHRLVWAGALLYAAFLVPILIYGLPRLLWQPQTGITFKHGVITSAAPDTGLHPGSHILSIEGDLRLGATARYAVPLWFRTGGTLQLQVLGPGGVRPVNLAVHRTPCPVLAWGAGLDLLVSLSYVLLGAVTAWYRPELRIARLCTLVSFLDALAFLSLTLTRFGLAGWAVPAPFAILSMVLPWHMVAGYWFFTVFFTDRPLSRTWRIISFSILATAPLWAILVFPYGLGTSGLSGEPLFWLDALPAWWLNLCVPVERIMSLLVLLATCAVLLRNYRHASSEDRRRISWVVIATCFSLFCVSVAPFWYRRWPAGSYFGFANATVLLCPLSVGYAITKHQIMGIRVIIRRSIQYILARRVLETAVALPVVAVITVALLRPDLRVRDLLHPFSAGCLTAALTGLLFRRQILRAVDRRFFRPAWNEEQMLSSLVETVRGQVDFHETDATVTHSIEQALRPENLLILYREERGAPLSFAGSALAEHTAFFDHLGASRSVLLLPRVRALLSQEERVWIEQTRAELLVPIQGAVRLRGLLILGPKKSEEPYTAAERKLLESIAAQVSIAHENYWLTNERVSAVLAERNRMARELHDNLAQGFAGISLHLQSAVKTIDTAPHTVALNHIEQARQLARESMAEARRSVHELRSGAHASSDLASMLRELAAKLSSDCLIEFETQDALPELPGEIIRNLYRIAQESITNALKHAYATRISVSLLSEGGRILLKVRDNGRGFETEPTSRGGYGLIGMRERAGHINGQVQIHSQAGAGTEVIARVSWP